MREWVNRGRRRPKHFPAGSHREGGRGARTAPSSRPPLRLQRMITGFGSFFSLGLQVIDLLLVITAFFVPFSFQGGPLIPDIPDPETQILMLPLILGFDHRVVDGADAARFLGIIMDALGNPEELLMMI